MTDELEPKESVLASRAKLVLLAFAAIGAFLLLAEHRAHVFPYLPWLFLAACPLMHVFMHRGHGHGGYRGHGSAGAGTLPDTGDGSAGAHNHQGGAP